MKDHIIPDATDRNNNQPPMINEATHAGRAQHSHIFPIEEEQELHNVEAPNQYR